MKYILSYNESKSSKSNLKYAFLFTDIKDSSKMWACSEKLMMNALDKHNKSIFKIVNNNKGMVIKCIGDAFMCRFDNLYDAIKCSIIIQEDIKNNPIKVKSNNIEIRIGISFGSVIEKEMTIQDYKLKDYFGNTVNSASRMESNVSDVGGLAFTYSGDIENEIEIKKLISKMKVKVINYTTSDNKVDFKRSSRLLTDEHNIRYKNIKDLNGAKPMMVYKCNF